MMQVSAGQRIAAAMVSIGVTAGAAQGMTELSRYEDSGRGLARAAAPRAAIVCAPVRAARSAPGTAAAVGSGQGKPGRRAPAIRANIAW